MTWQTLPGLSGNVYIPERGEQPPKHRCADCFACQHCGDERCALCREAGSAKRKSPRSACPGADRR